MERQVSSSRNKISVRKTGEPSVQGTKHQLERQVSSSRNKVSVGETSEQFKEQSIS